MTTPNMWQQQQQKKPTKKKWALFSKYNNRIEESSSNHQVFGKWNCSPGMQWCLTKRGRHFFFFVIGERSETKIRENIHDAWNSSDDLEEDRDDEVDKDVGPWAGVCGGGHDGDGTQAKLDTQCTHNHFCLKSCAPLREWFFRKSWILWSITTTSCRRASQAFHGGISCISEHWIPTMPCTLTGWWSKARINPCMHFISCKGNLKISLASLLHTILLISRVDSFNKSDEATLSLAYYISISYVDTSIKT